MPTTKGFAQLSKSKLYQQEKQSSGQDTSFVDEVMFGSYEETGGCHGEVAMRWYKVGDTLSRQLEIFDDAFHYILDFADVFGVLAKASGPNLTPERFCELLQSRGFVDLTQGGT